MKSTENNQLNEKSINQKVFMLLQLSKHKNVDENTLNQIAALTKEHSQHLRLGRVFGYSVSDYSFATLKWINTDYSIKIFDNLYVDLPEDRKRIIDELINSKAYNQL